MKTRIVLGLALGIGLSGCVGEAVEDELLAQPPTIEEPEGEFTDPEDSREGDPRDEGNDDDDASDGSDSAEDSADESGDERSEDESSVDEETDEDAGDDGDEDTDDEEPVIGPITLVSPASGVPGFLLVKDVDGTHTFHFENAEGEVLLTSQVYVSGRTTALNGMVSVRNNVPLEGRLQRQALDDGTFSYRLIATNHQEIATGPVFDTAEERNDVLATLADAMSAYVAYQSTTSEPVVEVASCEGDRYCFVVYRDHLEVLVGVESYRSEATALSAAFEMIALGWNLGAYVIDPDEDGRFTVAILEDDGETFVTSAMTFDSASAAEASIEDMMAMMRVLRVM